MSNNAVGGGNLTTLSPYLVTEAEDKPEGGNRSKLVFFAIFVLPALTLLLVVFAITKYVERRKMREVRLSFVKMQKGKKRNKHKKYSSGDATHRGEPADDATVRPGDFTMGARGHPRRKSIATLAIEHGRKSIRVPHEMPGRSRASTAVRSSYQNRLSHGTPGMSRPSTAVRSSYQTPPRSLHGDKRDPKASRMSRKTMRDFKEMTQHRKSLAMSLKAKKSNMSVKRMNEAKSRQSMKTMKAIKEAKSGQSIKPKKSVNPKAIKKRK